MPANDAMPCASCFALRFLLLPGVRVFIVADAFAAVATTADKISSYEAKETLRAPVIVGDQSVQRCQPFYLINT